MIQQWPRRNILRELQLIAGNMSYIYHLGIWIRCICFVSWWVFFLALTHVSQYKLYTFRNELKNSAFSKSDPSYKIKRAKYFGNIYFVPPDFSRVRVCDNKHFPKPTARIISVQVSNESVTRPTALFYVWRFGTNQNHPFNAEIYNTTKDKSRQQIIMLTNNQKISVTKKIIIKNFCDQENGELETSIHDWYFHTGMNIYWYRKEQPADGNANALMKHWTIFFCSWYIWNKVLVYDTSRRFGRCNANIKCMYRGGMN